MIFEHAEGESLIKTKYKGQFNQKKGFITSVTRYTNGSRDFTERFKAKSKSKLKEGAYEKALTEASSFKEYVQELFVGDYTIIAESKK